MSKTITIIDLLNKKANGEEVPEKILILDKVYYLIEDKDGDMVYSQLKDENQWEAFLDHKLNITRCLNEKVLILDGEVEIIEPKQDIDIQGIKEIDIEQIVSSDNKVGIALNHINKLIQVVKQLDRKIKEKE